MTSYLGNINDAVQRIMHFNRQLLQLSKDQAPEIRRLELNDLCRDSVKLCRSSLEKEINFDFALSSQPLPIAGDLFQLEEVIINVLINAGHSLLQSRSPNKADQDRIRLQTGRLAAGQAGNPLDTACCYVAIGDNGAGIPPEVLPHIFEPFFSTKGREKGSGLGLSIAWKIIQQHAGRIEVDSQSGAGARFTICLPEAPPPATPAP